MSTNWFQKAVDETAGELETDPKSGLSNDAARDRLARYGPNELAEAPKASALVIFLRQLKNPLLIILMVGAVISFYLDHVVDAVAILVIVFINATIGFIQEYKAEKSMDALKEMAAPTALVMRGGEWINVPARELVPGDVLKINTGDILGADVRLYEAHRLQIDESALTGESEPADKWVDAIEEPDVGIGDQGNMGFMSTIVTGGNGLGLVTSTGMGTQVGHIANLMHTAEDPKTPLERRLEHLSHILIGAALAVVAGVIGMGLNHGADLGEMLNTGISLSVAAIPEGLPTIVVIVLTLGSQKMARANALIRQLSSVETLGSTSAICSDKTGTLTQNQMQVMEVWAGGKRWQVTGQGFDPQGEFVAEDGSTINPTDDEDLLHTLLISAFNNESFLVEKDGRYGIQGNPTEGALVVAAAKAGITREQMERDGYEVLDRFPFDSTRKMMSVVVRTLKNETVLVSKGAPDVILSKAIQLRSHGEEVPLDDESRKNYEDAVDAFGHHALRTLAIAYKRVPSFQKGLNPEDFESDFVLLGLYGIMDPPRPEVIDAVRECWEASIRTVMITGDHAMTAQAIAEKIGIKRSEDDRVVTGAELERMSDEELRDVVPHAAVFARVSPEHKLRIVNALQATGQIVAMTGDGVNDAPALRAADIGVAMGITGTSVAKDSASLILLDDNFSTIVAAVGEGRRIYDNIKKFIRQALTANVSEVSVIMFAFLLMGDDPLVPITALMILWINLVSDGLPALALGLDNPEGDLMQRKPRSRTEGFFADNLGSRIVIRGLTIGWLAYYLFDFALDRGATVAYAQTLAFTSIVFSQLWHVFDARTFTSIYRRNPFSNQYLLWAVAGAALLSLGVVYTAPGQFVFGTEALQLKHLFMVIAIAALPTFILSGIKEIFALKWL